MSLQATFAAQDTHARRLTHSGGGHEHFGGVRGLLDGLHDHSRRVDAAAAQLLSVHVVKPGTNKGAYQCQGRAVTSMLTAYLTHTQP